MAKNLTSMKRTAADKKARKEQFDKPFAGDQDDFPHGLLIVLNEESLKKLKIAQEVSGGEMVDVVARAKVREIKITDTDGSKKPERVELQIQEMTLKRDSKEEFKAGFEAKS